MDPVSAVGVAFLVAPLLYAFKGQEFWTLSRTYGSHLALIVIVIFPNTASEYDRLERVVLRGREEEALLFRDAVANECNMTAIAGAIIAQVALTALSLPNLSQAHWTARAFLLFATVAGCLSVYYACKLQRDVGKLYRPAMIRDWLRVGSHMETLRTHRRRDTIESKNPKASLSAIFLLSAPYSMMSYSILAFIIGLAIYQGFTWTRALDTAAGQINSRNVFIAYIVSTGFCQAFFVNASFVKAIENWVDFGRLRTILPTADENLRNKTQITASQPEENPATGTADIEATSTQNARHASEQREPEVGDLVAALEAAAKAHILSAEADRRVASEYARMSDRRQDSIIAE